MIPVIIIRPQPGCDITVSAANEMGLTTHGFPMFEVREIPWDAPPRDSVDALLIGSKNALRHGGAALSTFKGLPVYAVGEKTADAAAEAGLDVIATGEGGLQQMLDQLRPEHRTLLRLAGKERVDLTIPEGVSVTERVVYASDPVPMPSRLGSMLRKPALVLLHSGEAARHFAGSCDARAIDRSQISIAAIGPRVAKEAGEGWRNVQLAAKPSDEALLALAREMCEKADKSQDAGQEKKKGLMQDKTGNPNAAVQLPAKRRGRSYFTIALLAFVLGAALVGWSVWRGHLDSWLPRSEQPAPSAITDSVTPEPDAIQTPDMDAATQRELKAVSTVEARLAMLEERFSRLNLQANAASGNAARAESLLIAFAARRMIDRGEPLRYLDDQLRLRFANAQPRAVETIIEFGEAPLTIDELSARLEALSPQLIGGANNESFWDSATRELSGLFTVRREPSAMLSPEARLERARVMLTAGKIPEAVAQVELLPGIEAANKWISDARRYAAAQKALDLIEVAAMLEPSRLKDSEGNKVNQPSPLANPATAAEKAAAR